MVKCMCFMRLNHIAQAARAIFWELCFKRCGIWMFAVEMFRFFLLLGGTKICVMKKNYVLYQHDEIILPLLLISIFHLIFT